MSSSPTESLNQTEVRRTISPYDLTAADNPGAVISHPLLKGNNYDEWACGLKTALTSRKKFGFLDGSIKRPDDNSPDFDDWKTIQALLVSWMKMTIDPTLRSTISHRDVAQDLWDHLKRRFSVMNGLRLQQLQAELANCKQRGLAIETYFGKLNRIWDNLATHRPLRTCKCGKCVCDLGTTQEADREEDKVHQFLFGLDDQYRAVRSSLVSRMPVQSLEEIYNIIRQEEDMRVVGEERSEVTAFVTQSRSPYKTDAKDRSVACKHCNRTGHSSDSCYAIVGYPEWWGDRPKGRTLNNRGRGHSIGAGRGRGQITFANRVNVPNVENQTVQQANYVVTDNDRNGVNGLSEQQWRMLKNILNVGNDPSSTEKLSGPHFEDGDWSG